MTENSTEDEVAAFTVSDAAYIVRDGIDLLDCVDGVDDTNANSGSLLVTTEQGSFEVQIDLVTDASLTHRSEYHGGIWGEHPDHPSADWRIEVENQDTRLGYWDWVGAKAEQAIDDEADDDDNDDHSVEEDGSVDYSRDYSLTQPTC